MGSCRAANTMGLAGGLESRCIRISSGDRSVMHATNIAMFTVVHIFNNSPELTCTKSSSRRYAQQLLEAHWSVRRWPGSAAFHSTGKCESISCSSAQYRNRAIVVDFYQ